MRENLVDTAVQIRLDGQDFILKYRALAFIEYAKHGGDLLNDLRALGAQLADISLAAKEGQVARLAPMFEMIRDILWAGLIDAQPMLQREDVARLFTFRDLEPLAVQIGKAIAAGMPEVKGERPIAPARATGRRSRSSGGVDSGESSATQAASGTPSSAA